MARGLLFAAAFLLSITLPRAETAPVGVACEDLTKLEACVECIGSKCLACQKDRAATWSSDGSVTEVSWEKVFRRRRKSSIGDRQLSPPVWPAAGASRFQRGTKLWPIARHARPDSARAVAHRPKCRGTSRLAAPVHAERPLCPFMPCAHSCPAHQMPTALHAWLVHLKSGSLMQAAN